MPPGYAIIHTQGVSHEHRLPDRRFRRVRLVAGQGRCLVRQEGGREIDGVERAGVFLQRIAFFFALVRFSHENAAGTVGSSRCSSFRLFPSV